MISQVVLLSAVLAVAVASLSLVHEPVHHHAPQPYKFGYDVKDKHGEQFRQETGDGGHAVKGSYGFIDVRGVKRQVVYVADKAGFRAQVKTNEPGTANQNPAAVIMVSDAPYAGGLGHGIIGHGGLGYGNIGHDGVGYAYGGPIHGGYDLGYAGYGY